MRAHHEKEMKENYFPSIVFNLCEKIESDTPLWAWKKTSEDVHESRPSKAA